MHGTLCTALCPRHAIVICKCSDSKAKQKDTIRLAAWELIGHTACLLYDFLLWFSSPTFSIWSLSRRMSGSFPHIFPDSRILCSRRNSLPGRQTRRDLPSERLTEVSNPRVSPSVVTVSLCLQQVCWLCVGSAFEKCCSCSCTHLRLLFNSVCQFFHKPSVFVFLFSGDFSFFCFSFFNFSPVQQIMNKPVVKMVGAQVFFCLQLL